ncbi:Imm26 family immunity protein [Paenibacillus sp. WLX1005]|uniref:Imm26 family immunity protein n=1 Tax=Paenibacillus sp. WLX1005 TaxID=3243766 RepID=UPI003984434C
MPRRKYETGDIFTIPMHDGRFAICQIVCALRGRLKQALPFGVLYIGRSQELPADHDGEFLVFDSYRGSFQVIFGAVSNINAGRWNITSHLPLTPEKEALQIFRYSTSLYHGDTFLRILPQAEWGNYQILEVAGNELVQNYLAQH